VGPGNVSGAMNSRAGRMPAVSGALIAGYFFNSTIVTSL
jgi:hypothetical protein